MFATRHLEIIGTTRKGGTPSPISRSGRRMGLLAKSGGWRVMEMESRNGARDRHALATKFTREKTMKIITNKVIRNREPNGMYPAVLLALLVAGCATNPTEYLGETAKVDPTSVFTNIDRDKFEQIDLGKLFAVYAPPNNDSTLKAILDGKASTDDATAISAERAFHQAALANANQGRSARNALQERMLAASTQRCNAFKAQLQRTFSRTNFGLGVLGTLSGTVGALVNGAAASNWSGASALFSGIRAEYNQDYAANLAVYVITDGIDQKQREVYAQIQKHGQDKPYSDYPVQAAVKDALYYHGLCSVLTGFQVAQSSIREVENPGMTSSLKILARLKIANKMQHDDNTSVASILEDLKSVDSVQPLLAGSTLGKGGSDQTMGDSANQAFEDQVAKVGKADDSLIAGVKALSEKITKANLSNKIKAPEFNGARTFKSKDVLDKSRLPCLGKLSDLLYAEQKALADSVKPEATEPDITDAKIASQDAHSRQAYIVVSFASAATGYANMAKDRLAEWNSTLDAAITDKGLDAAKIKAFTDSYAKPVDLDQDPLKAHMDKLNNLCGVK